MIKKTKKTKKRKKEKFDFLERNLVGKLIHV